MKKLALITGGSSGLGFSIAKQLGTEGYRVILLARNQQRLDTAVEKLVLENSEAIGISCDVTEESQLRDAAERVKREYGKIDFLVINAGEVSTTLLSDYKTIAELKKDLEVDLWGTIQTAYFFTPLLVEGSRLLMISSGFGLIGSAGYSIYCAAKAGIINFGESLRRELLRKKIGVYVACPGDMDTPQFHNEIKGQPEWMKTGSPRKLMQVEVSAHKILKKCKGHTRFLIITGTDVKLLAIVSKILPRTWKDKIIDSILPRP
jgi:3-dehydrosphinganine reductase